MQEKEKRKTRQRDSSQVWLLPEDLRSPESVLPPTHVYQEGVGPVGYESPDQPSTRSYPRTVKLVGASSETLSCLCRLSGREDAAVLQTQSVK